MKLLGISLMILVFNNSFYFILVDLIWESVFIDVS